MIAHTKLAAEGVKLATEDMKPAVEEMEPEFVFGRGQRKQQLQKTETCDRKLHYLCNLNHLF